MLQAHSQTSPFQKRLEEIIQAHDLEIDDLVCQLKEAERALSRNRRHYPTAELTAMWRRVRFLMGKLKHHRREKEKFLAELAAGKAKI